MADETKQTPDQVVEETKAETEQIKAASASVSGLIAYCIAHPVQTVVILLAAGLVITFSLSGWKVGGAKGTIEKSAVELRK